MMEEVGGKDKLTTIHVNALDSLVNVNSLFTMAVFLGLSFGSPGQGSLSGRHPQCDAGVGVLRRLFLFEVVSFSFFLFSSLVAQGMKLAINIRNTAIPSADKAHVDYRYLRAGMATSAFGSVMGCTFLMVSMVYVIEVKLGLLSCKSPYADSAVAVAVLVAPITTALLIYVATLSYTFNLRSSDTETEAK